jgi:glutamyl-tRNA synthetase
MRVAIAKDGVGRLAPSPTGAQHVGNARTYLVAWLAARTRNALLRLRIEDIDSPRIKPGATEQACADLRWLGLTWDGTPVVQTERLELYMSALRVLQEQELVYPCTCSRADVERAASAPHAEQQGVIYLGTCAGSRVATAETLGSQPYCWRFRAGTEAVEFQDGKQGLVRLTPQEFGGDFVVWKTGWTPAYQLAVVVDDADMGITQVVRGNDLIPSTPRQLLLYRALGLCPPEFIHVPLVVGADGRRLAKRHGDTRLAALREAGVNAEALIGLLAWSCGWLKRREPISALELLPLFRLETIPAQPFVLTSELLKEIGYT